ncbi:hypothetical protein Xcel_1781 [Xylanimonas cellulosilytica DSM 15894]|uniref:Uncharacterized protein n=1 Tax=Xylanimonas cellulosilytica (strain DSM 15894 / JCM 12276 / CECT 5975 / KCTC 9989 / LMG 20990 / NBRC 107835 / XIL07) TaxID=446471 RepID=D1BSV9_XYLCX|nr:hypothetical protein [Xylanimonas cellulosilytica]ACZ30801.1 hypothetical protein Xcel_1781 [Xylanimonas cellulosilytica DSM 15894]
MWWAIWGVLVVGTLVGAFFLARELWRKGVALARALGEAGAALGAASERIGEAVEQAQEHPVDTSPTIFEDRTVLHERVALLREARAERAEARRARWWGTARGWSLDGWLADRQAARRKR